MATGVLQSPVSVTVRSEASLLRNRVLQFHHDGTTQLHVPSNTGGSSVTTLFTSQTGYSDQSLQTFQEAETMVQGHAACHRKGAAFHSVLRPKASPPLLPASPIHSCYCGDLLPWAGVVCGSGVDYLSGVHRAPGSVSSIAIFFFFIS